MMFPVFLVERKQCIICWCDTNWLFWYLWKNTELYLYMLSCTYLPSLWLRLDISCRHSPLGSKHVCAYCHLDPRQCEENAVTPPSYPPFCLPPLSLLTRAGFYLPWTRGGRVLWLQVQSLELEYKAPNLMLTLCQHILTLWCWTWPWGKAKLPHSHCRCDAGFCHHLEATRGPHEVIHKECLESSCPPHDSIWQMWALKGSSWSI